MRIGAFAEKHHVTIDTLRYYIKIGLLLPKREGIRYNFDEHCHRTMEIITLYKSLHFSIEEIRRMLSVQYLFNGSPPITKEALIALLHEKAKETEIRIRNEQAALGKLRKQISDMENKPGLAAKQMLPLSVLELLICPLCERGLKANSQSKKTGVLQGRVSCSCGFSLVADRTILKIDNSDHGFMMENPKDFITQFLNTGKGNEIVHSLDKHIIDAGERVSGQHGNILFLQNLPVLKTQPPPESGYYILIAHNMDYLEMVYERVADTPLLGKSILIHCSADTIPLKSNTISVIYDFFYSDTAMAIHKTRFLKRLTALLRCGAEYYHIGLFLDKTFHSKDPATPLQHFIQANVRQQFEAAGLVMEETEKMSTSPLKTFLSGEMIDQAARLGFHPGKDDQAYIRSSVYQKTNRL